MFKYMNKNFNEMRPGIALFISLIFLSILVDGYRAKADESLIRIQAEVDKSIITIGDRIHYILTIEHAQNLFIQKPGPGANLGMFEIKDFTIYDPVEKEGKIIQKFEYEISVFDTGRFVIPPFPVAFSDSDTSRLYQIIQSEPLEIYVKSVLSAEDRDIKDIKPPQNIPINYKKWLQFVAFAVFILAAMVFLYYWFRLRKKGLTIFGKEPIRPAHEIAFEQLSLLKEKWREMLSKEEHKMLFTQLSEILRKYMENRFFIKALEETTSEIAHSLQEVNIDPDSRNKAVSILEFADLVKFAKYMPGEVEVEQQLSDLENFIEQTKLVLEEVEEKTEIPAGSEDQSAVPAAESTEKLG